MSDAPAATTSSVASSPAAPVVTPPVVSGWKTTEHWMAYFVLGALLWALQALVSVLPTIAATPGLPGWAAPILSLAPIGVAWVMKKVVVAYTEQRTALKLDALAAPTMVPTTDQAAANVVAALK